MSPANASTRHDDAAPAREIVCPDCAGTGDAKIVIHSTVSPGESRTFHQRCTTCGGCGKVPSYGGDGQ